MYSNKKITLQEITEGLKKSTERLRGSRKVQNGQESLKGSDVEGFRKVQWKDLESSSRVYPGFRRLQNGAEMPIGAQKGLQESNSV